MFKKSMENIGKTLYFIIWSVLLALCFWFIVDFLASKVTAPFIKLLIFLVLYFPFNKFILNKKDSHSLNKNHKYLIKNGTFLLIALGYILIKIVS